MTYYECMQGNLIINTSGNTSKSTQNLIFTQVSHFLEDTYMLAHRLRPFMPAYIYTYIGKIP